MTDRLLPPRTRPYAAFLVGLCAMVTLALGIHYANTSRPGRIDRTLDLHIQDRLAAHHGLLNRLAHLGDPQSIIAWCLLLTLLCVAAHRWRGMALSIAGPLLAGGLTDLVLKPLIDRRLGNGLVFPSGHTTGAFAVAVVAGVLLLSRRNPSRLAVTVRAVVGVLALALAAGVAASVVGLGFHYTTDTIGGFCVAVGVVLGVALLIDELGDRLDASQAPARDRYIS